MKNSFEKQIEKVGGLYEETKDIINSLMFQNGLLDESEYMAKCSRLHEINQHYRDMICAELQNINFEKEN